MDVSPTAWAGAPFEKGPELAFPTHMFRVGNVAAEQAIAARPRIRELMLEAEQAGQFRFARRSPIVAPQKRSQEWRCNVTQISSASDKLRSQASALGSNLSIVQIRQDFNKNLINVLQTGSSNLTLADTNEEAANSQALSTRQSIAVSALALANQSQQSVLQLLR